MTAKTATPAIVVTQFHKDVYSCAQIAAKADVTMAQKMNALILARYGETAPTFEAYRDDQRALALIAKQRGLADNQWVRKPYAAAIKARFGALPVSQSPEAVLKAAKRAAALAQRKAALAVLMGKAKPGAEKGKTTARVPSDAENLEALITRIGVFNALDACIRILESDKSTQGAAVHMKAQASKAAQLAAAATVTTTEPKTQKARKQAAANEPAVVADAQLKAA